VKLRLAALLAVTALCLALALRGIELDKAQAALAAASGPRLLAVWAFYAVAHAIRVWRLGVLLDGAAPFTRLLVVNSIGFLAINVMPLRLGEAVRPWLLVEREGVPLGRALLAIVVERLLDLLGLVGLLIGLGVFVDLPASGLQVAGVDVVRAAQAGATLLGGAVTTALLVTGFAGPALFRLLAAVPRVGPRLVPVGERFRAGLVDLARRPARAALLVAQTAAVWLVTVGAVATCLSAFPSLPATLSAAWSTWAVTLSAMSAVPTAGFFGVYEAAATAALVLFGVDGSLARTFAVVLHLGQLSFTVLIGTLALLSAGLGLRDLVRPAAPGAAG
jgi:uncharacterized membrane protein YbhN (UPF0104 family)